METLLGIAMGVGLSAAAGFRVFVPLLVLGLAARFSLLGLAPGFEWLGSGTALVALAVATVVEIAAYAIPGLDHVLDAMATPLALVAATLMSAAMLPDLPPFVRWAVAAIAGGGAAGLVQGATVLLRLHSGTLTAGLANPLVWAVELFGELGTAILAVTLPILAVVFVAALCVLIFRGARRLAFGRARAPR